MEVIHLNQKNLAQRWHVSEATLERWRCDGIGPKFLKLSGRVLYRLALASVWVALSASRSSNTHRSR